tara:strand:- start:186 stop:710 length:525 start_codon:yes stop_codon:yes gene_type:complete
MREDIYSVNDYVKYIGDYSTLDPIRRNESYAQIIMLKKYEQYWLVGLRLLESNEKISCIIDKIRPIETEEKHLKILGFKIDKEKFQKYYFKNGITISSIGLKTLNKYSNSIFYSGLCIADFSDKEMKYFEKFYNGDEIDIKKFFNEYPSVNNINNLFLEIGKKWKINEEEIICR